MTNRNGRRPKQTPFWADRAPRSKYDLVQLRPATLGSGQRFETVDDAEHVARDRCERVLRIHAPWARRVARKLAACDQAHRCELPLCAMCARAYRRWLTGEALRLLESDGREAKVLTLLLLAIREEEELPKTLTGYKDLLRRRMRRAQMTDVVAIGGFEISYSQQDAVFILHAHVCVIGVTTEQIEALRPRFKGLSRSFKAQDLKDPAEQLSYLLKLTDYHRPGQRYGSRKARAYPMPNSPFEIRSRWISGLSFGDLTFLMNARRTRRGIERSLELP